MTIKICHLWYDALNWNGSQGNVRCLKKRLEWRDIPVEIQEIPVGAQIDFDVFDLIYIGAGKAYENHTLLRDVVAKADALRKYASSGGAILAVCEGFELLGQLISIPDGSTYPGLGIIDMKTIYKPDRLTGNAVIETPFCKAVYFENHAGRIYPDDGIPILGCVLKGHGNNGLDGLAGVHKDNVFGCQAHGPLLPKNPDLADEILRSALFRRYPDQILSTLDDTQENRARDHILSALL